MTDLPLRGILESALYCDDLDAAEAFYRRLFGHPPLAKQTGRMVVFRVGDDVLLLFNPAATERGVVTVGTGAIPLHGARGPGHVAFRITREEAPDWRRRLAAAGVPIESEIDWPNGGLSLYFRDPAGNSLELATSAIWWSDPPIRTLNLPGLWNSGPDHWQTRWEILDPSFRRLHQDDWEAPRCADWVARLESTLRGLPVPVRLTAHSSSCAMVAHWAAAASPESARRVTGALLVAPSDPTGPKYPPEPTGFAPVPLRRLPFPSIVVASDDDEYVALERAREYAAAWGSRLVVLPGAGHINSASGLGDWPEGLALLASLGVPVTPA